jgi:hypothetical protein
VYLVEEDAFGRLALPYPDDVSFGSDIDQDGVLDEALAPDVAVDEDRILDHTPLQAQARITSLHHHR